MFVCVVSDRGSLHRFFLRGPVGGRIWRLQGTPTEAAGSQLLFVIRIKGYQIEYHETRISPERTEVRGSGREQGFERLRSDSSRDPGVGGRAGCMQN